MASGGWVVLGTLIGAMVGLAGAYISIRAENRRHRQRLALESGLREWERQLEFAQQQAGASGGSWVFPVFSFVHFYTRLLDLLEKKGLNPEGVRQLLQERDRITEVLREHMPQVARPNGARTPGGE